MAKGGCVCHEGNYNGNSCTCDDSNAEYVVGSDKKVEQRRVKLGQSTPTTAVIASGLQEGEMVVADGIQRVRPGMEVNAGPASPPPLPVPGPQPAPGPQSLGKS